LQLNFRETVGHLASAGVFAACTKLIEVMDGTTDVEHNGTDNATFRRMIELEGSDMPAALLPYA